MTRIAAAEVLVGGTKTARALLAGVDKKTVAPADISATARRALATSSDATIADNADKLLGKYRKPGADKLKLIAEKRAVVLAGTSDLSNGHEVAKKTCFVCHKLYGEGADVGPDLTGVGRSTLDALLHNVIDRAIQVFGAMGLTPDTPLARLWSWGRALRFLDGPDEVHLRAISRHELALAKARGGANAAQLRKWMPPRV